MWGFQSCDGEWRVSNGDKTFCVDSWDQAIELSGTLNGYEMGVQYKDVTRVTLVDYTKENRGRVYEKWDIKIRTAIQDDGRTLKVFVTDRRQ